MVTFISYFGCSLSLLPLCSKMLSCQVCITIIRVVSNTSSAVGPVFITLPRWGHPRRWCIFIRTKRYIALSPRSKWVRKILQANLVETSPVMMDSKQHTTITINNQQQSRKVQIVLSNHRDDIDIILWWYPSSATFKQYRNLNRASSINCLTSLVIMDFSFCHVCSSLTPFFWLTNSTFDFDLISPTYPCTHLYHSQQSLNFIQCVESFVLMRFY